MDLLPDELITQVLEYLEPPDVISVQRVSSRLLKLSRDNALWRLKCFSESPCAATLSTLHQGNSSLWTGLRGQTGLVAHEQSTPEDNGPIAATRSQHSSGTSNFLKAIATWDRTDLSEQADWYSEYVARHASLSVTWANENPNATEEVRGLAVSKDGTRAVGPLENGGLCIWDIAGTQDSPLSGRRAFRELSRSPPKSLFEDRSRLDESSARKVHLAFPGVGECVAIDSYHSKAYVAVGVMLNEVDLESLRVVSQNRYAWPITSLSQDDSPDRPLTVGTNWSLHLHDPRMQFRERSRSPEDVLKSAPSSPEDSIAFLPNYTKGIPRRYEPPRVISEDSPVVMDGRPSVVSHFNLPSSRPHRAYRRSTLSDYAQIEPGPLSIVHQGQDNIFIAGRFPSILSYDRRFFPKLQYVIHSGARLSAITTIPYPPCGTTSRAGVEATLVACGEYKGCGSLELYSLPHTRQGNGAIPKTQTSDAELSLNSSELPAAAEQALSNSLELVGASEPYNYKNRQSASTSKLLSVASHGTRIVFSDSEGSIKWVERDGSGLVRRWNINNYQVHGNSASIQGEQVIRKIIPIEPHSSERGARGDGDLLVWTGEKLGIITTQASPRSVDELSKAFDDSLRHDDDDTKVEEYSRVMRRALEQQADERRWMSRFNMRYR